MTYFRGVLNMVKEKERIEPYKKFVRPYYENRDPAHDFQHIERIISLLDLLSKELPTPPCRDRLYFLACFHEVWSRLRDDAMLRQQTKAFLHNLGWNDSEIEEAFQSLERHIKSPETVEEKIVHDANYVEILGAFGIAKAFTTGGAKGQSFEETAEILERFLNKVVFQTPVGKRLAEEGRAYVKEFLRRLRKEW
jgi:uncharacterized protein